MTCQSTSLVLFQQVISKHFLTKDRLVQPDIFKPYYYSIKPQIIMKHFFIFLIALAIPCFTSAQTTFGMGAGILGIGSSYFGKLAGASSNTNSGVNAFFGFEAGRDNGDGFDNCYFGFSAGSWSFDGGHGNTFFGSQAGEGPASSSFLNGINNTFAGTSAGINSRPGSNNTYLGYNSGIIATSSITTSDRNTVIGSSSAQTANIQRNNNTWIGYEAGLNNMGSANVFIGHQAGRNSTGSNRLYIDNSNTSQPLIYGNFTSGAVGINTNQLSDGNTAYALSVNGKMRANEVKVYTGWADYVFEPGYKLRSLKRVNRYIRRHKHLPDIPSAKQVQKNGIFVGKTQATLLRKIEELTLYMIAAHKTSQQLQKEAHQLNNSVKTLHQRLAQLKQENQQLKARIKN